MSREDPCCPCLGRNGHTFPWEWETAFAGLALADLVPCDPAFADLVPCDPAFADLAFADLAFADLAPRDLRP